jgi:hypothetical protein
MQGKLFGSSLGGSSYHPPHQDFGYLDKLANLPLNQSLVLSETLPTNHGKGKYVVSRLPGGLNTVKSPTAIGSQSKTHQKFHRSVLQ